ncbi:curlin [Rhizobium sp. RU36D]|uniref:curlin n=1 Tax=Rhizobium sp. RU36D TaxID=1907415 RepID=UPI0009D885FA|nr:curlin [Rhizobium sp. RU36D]SMC50435.1 major curlin subunit [Rhizobium sp. RU36D]
MKKTVFTLISISLLAGSLGQVVMAVPAQAGGSISFNVAPRSGAEADLLATGLRAYSLYRDLKGGDIRQLGNGNSAGIAQGGRRNLGFIRQQGDGHSATLQQNGNDNAYGIFQYGRNTDNNVVQRGNNGIGATFSYGW